MMWEPFLDVQKKPRQRNHDLAKPWQTTCAVGRKAMAWLIGNRQAAEALLLKEVRSGKRMVFLFISYSFSPQVSPCSITFPLQKGQKYRNLVLCSQELARVSTSRGEV